jgi:hypothetical protein
MVFAIHATTDLGTGTPALDFAHEFLEKDQAQTLGKEISEQLPQPPEDDAENWKQP